MTENKKPMCKECKTPVEPTAAKKHFEQYQGVYCPECRDKIDKAIEDGLIAGDKAGDKAHEPPKSEETIDNTDSKTRCVDADYEVVDGETYAAPTHITKTQASPELTISDIKKYICPTATDKEAYTFMQLCSARNLNPFTKEAYLIKYGGGDATIIVGKDAFTRRAEEHPMFDGFDAGIIVKDTNGEISSLDGTFYTEDQVLLGGWAIVHRKDHTRNVCARVTMKEYVGINKTTGKPNAQWTKMPATMIRKVALVQALREAFPSDLGGCYDASEMGV